MSFINCIISELEYKIRKTSSCITKLRHKSNMAATRLVNFVLGKNVNTGKVVTSR